MSKKLVILSLGAFMFAAVAFTVVGLNSSASAYSTDSLLELDCAETVAISVLDTGHSLGGRTSGGADPHLIKRCTTWTERIPVIKKVCSWVREENPGGAGSSLVKKCKTSLGWKERTVRECEYEEHAWEH